MSRQFLGCTKSRVLLTQANIHFLIIVFAFPLHSAQLRSHILPFSFGFPILCSLMAMVRLFFLIRLIAPCKGIQDSPGFWIPRRGLRIPVFVSGTWILDSKCDVVRFRVFELYSGFWSPGFRIPEDSGNQILCLHSVRLRKALNSALHETRDFKMPRRRRQRERQKSNWLNKQNNNSARASRFFVHFFTVTTRLRGENA